MTKTKEPTPVAAEVTASASATSHAVDQVTHKSGTQVVSLSVFPEFADTGITFLPTAGDTLVTPVPTSDTGVTVSILYNPW